MNPSFPPFWPRFPWVGGDLQTLRNYLSPGGWDLSAWPSERLFFDTDDGSGDRLQGVLHRNGDGLLVVLLHGLTGCEESFYVLETARFLLSQEISVLRLNLRGAGPSRKTCQGHYCAGSSADLANVLEQLPSDLVRRGVGLIGYSLGGNIVLKYLAEHSLAVEPLCAIAVSAPIDLAAASRRMMAPRNRLYHRWLLKRMSEEAAGGSAVLSDAERATINGVRSVYAFDDRFVAPRNGFADADEYYRKCSAGGMLAEIETPALLIHARNDPWIPADAFEDIDLGALPKISLALADSGGHVGFHGREGRTPWHNQCAYTYFVSFLDRPLAP
ncbi:MAG: putative alpha/beta-fold hydrolase [Paracoccaceae bacterium]